MPNSKETIAKAVTEAKAKGTEIDVLARILAEKMQAIHGREFHILINHEAGFITVLRR